MAITTLDGVIAGAQYPRYFNKAVNSGNFVAGRPHALHTLGTSTASVPPLAVLGSAVGNMPQNYTITAMSKANPTIVSCAGHPWANNDYVSFEGTNCVPSADDLVYQISNVVAGTSFTVPHNVNTTAGTTGRCSGLTGGVATDNPLNGSALTSFSGQLPFTNPTSGNTYLSRFLGYSSGQAGTLMLCDRLLHTGGYMPTKTTAQTGPVPTQIPARDINGTNNGVGVYAALEVYSALGNSTATPTLTYTDSSGNAGATTTTTRALANGAIAGSFLPFDLAAGDVGIQKVQALTLGATASSGVLGVVLYRVIARLEIPNSIPAAMDILSGGFARIYDDSCLFLVFIPNTTTTSGIKGYVVWTQG